jgi:hypothetical protein
MVPAGFLPLTVQRGVMALEFIKKQIDAGIEAQKDHF